MRRLDPDGLLTTQEHASPIRQRRLLLADTLFENDALIFDDLRSRHVTYGAATGPRIRLSFPDAPYLGSGANRARDSCVSSRGRESPIRMAMRHLQRQTRHISCGTQGQLRHANERHAFAAASALDLAVSLFAGIMFNNHFYV